MAANQAPSFLNNGTFFWDELGYSYSEPPPQNLLTSQALTSDDAWIALASSLEHAKAGKIGRLSELAKHITVDSPVLVRGIVHLLGDAGAAEGLKALQSLIASEQEWLSAKACCGAEWAGTLWLIPSILDAWQRAKKHTAREKISCMLSNLLEERPGPISDSAGRSPDEYLNLVRGVLDELRRQFTTDNVPIYQGKLFGVTSFATRSYQMLIEGKKKPFGLGVQFISIRHKFEAATGIDCTSFFRDRKFQPLAAAAIFEEFLGSPAASKYQEGMRYFYGHRIPD